MTSRERLLVMTMTLLFTVNLAAQAIKTIAIDDPPDGPLKQNQSYPLVLTAETEDGSPAASKAIKVEVASSDAEVKKTGAADTTFAASINVTTDAQGKAEVTLRTKTRTDVMLDLIPLTGTNNDQPVNDLKTTVTWRGITSFVVEEKAGPLTKRTVYPEALVISAKGQGDQPASLQKMKVRVVGDKDARVFVDSSQARTRETTVVTDADGVASVSVETGQDLDLEFLVIPLNAAGEEIRVGEKSIELSGLREFQSTFHSRRLFTELFTGATFTNDYDEEGNNLGFDETGPLIRLTFDTLWYNRKLPREAGLIRGSLLHTGVDMEVSSFPFGDDADPEEETPPPPPGGGEPEPEPADEGRKGLENAFSGALFAIWQPDHWFWASYTPTSTLKGVPTDALRLGVFTKIGITTRPTAKENGDTSFYRYQIGFRFTHHQTTVESAGREQDNIVPIRFVEVSYGRFEEFANEVDANRLVFDAGFRLPGMGSDAIPFYAGIHLNAGRGADDLRIFAGFLFKINQLAAMFQRVGVEP